MGDRPVSSEPTVRRCRAAAASPAMMRPVSATIPVRVARATWDHGSGRRARGPGRCAPPVRARGCDGEVGTVRAPTSTEGHTTLRSRSPRIRRIGRAARDRYLRDAREPAIGCARFEFVSATGRDRRREVSPAPTTGAMHDERRGRPGDDDRCCGPRFEHKSHQRNTPRVVTAVLSSRPVGDRAAQHRCRGIDLEHETKPSGNVGVERFQRGARGFGDRMVSLS